MKFARALLREQERHGRLGLAENPYGSAAWQEPGWPGEKARMDQCRMGLKLPGRKARVRKRTRLQCVPGQWAPRLARKCACTRPHDIAMDRVVVDGEIHWQLPPPLLLVPPHRAGAC